MSDTRKLVALLIAVIAFGLVIFGVARGLSSAGPASGTRLLVSIGPPVDEASVAHATEAAQAALPAARVLGGGDGLVVEIATQDSKAVAEAAGKLESDHRMHVDRSVAFTRATGFVPRAWPFFAIAAVMLAGAALIARRR